MFESSNQKIWLKIGILLQVHKVYFPLSYIVLEYIHQISYSSYQ